jgi:hypothetical protein
MRLLMVHISAFCAVLVFGSSGLLLCACWQSSPGA